jgi:hypothetical protein
MKLIRSGIVSAQEATNVGELPPGNSHPVRKLCLALQPDQVLRIYRDEWNWQGKTPQVIVNDLNRKGPNKYTITVAADDSSWFIRRAE